MLILAMPALAVDFPWECPSFTEPADAAPYRDTDGGLDEVWGSLHAEAAAYAEDPSCAWVETTTVDGDTTTIQRVCAWEATTVTVTESTWAMEDAWAWYRSTREQIEVERAATEGWTRLLVRTTHTVSSTSSYSGGGSLGSYAEWDGTIPGLPDDAWFSVTGGSSYSGGPDGRGRHIETPACTLSWNVDGDGDDYSESVLANSTIVSVYAFWSPRCAELPYVGQVDGGRVGAVHRDTWELDAGDVDRDGFVGECDCDDADPAVNPGVYDSGEADGVDADCDGLDSVEEEPDADADRDGDPAPRYGGADCDDTEPTVFSGADDPAADGVDQDCDGADDVDADGDGFTADGDDREADCDDLDAARAPEAEDIPYDGLDQDCSGVDLTDVDGDSYAAAVVGGPDCDDHALFVHPAAFEFACDGVDSDCDGLDPCDRPEAAAPPEPRGCGGAASLAFLPLLATRRRRR